MKDLCDTKAYYINLPGRTDRKKKFLCQDALCAMPPLTYIAAVKGAALDVKTDKRIGVHTRVQVITEYRRSHYEIHSKGALGASLSHLKTWKAFLASGAKYALILEDDAELPATFGQMVRDCAKDLPAGGWGIWLLGWNHDPKDRSDSKPNSPFRDVVQFVGAHAYIVTRAAAQALVKEALPIETHVEYFMSNVALLHGFSVIRHTNLGIKQIDRVKNKSDVRKPEGCTACAVDDKDEAVAAREANS
jgi:GR25 family glycosyltransferase involved in LPS biosynthesis